MFAKGAVLCLSLGVAACGSEYYPTQPLGPQATVSAPSPTPALPTPTPDPPPPTPDPTPAPAPEPMPLPSPPPAPPESGLSRVGVGESVRVTLGPEDFVAFDQFGEAYWKRIVYVASRERALVEVRAFLDERDSVHTIYVGHATGRNCDYGPHSIRCWIPANSESPFVVTVSPGPGTDFAGRAVPAAQPTFTLITQQVEE